MYCPEPFKNYTYCQNKTKCTMISKKYSSMRTMHTDFIARNTSQFKYS